MFFLLSAALAAPLPADAYPTAPRSTVELGEETVVLLADGTIDTWRGNPPQKTASTRIEGATDLFVQANRVWVITTQTRAQPLNGTVVTPVTPSTTVVSAGSSMAGAAPSGAVKSVSNGVIGLDIGRSSGITPGDTVAFYHGGQDGSETLVGTGKVRSAATDHATVDLSRGSRVLVGDRVERGAKAGKVLVTPGRLGGIREVGMVLRPVLPLGTVGLGFVNDLWCNWTFEQPWYAEVRIAPFGLGWSKDGNPLTAAATLTGGYDSQFFSVGLGGGWSLYNGDYAVFSQEYSVNQAADGGGASFTNVSNTLAVVQQARLGARDGLSLELRNTFLLVPEYSMEMVTNDTGEPTLDENGNYTYVTKKLGTAFNYGGLAMRLNVPTGLRTDLFADWSFGDAGFVVVEGGVSSWLRGNGDKGSLGLQVGVGYGMVSGANDNREVSLAGPMVSVGGRGRF